MEVLRDVIDGDFPDPWRYFDIATVSIANEEVIITRTGFSNELGWEFYLRPENDAEKVGERYLGAGPEVWNDTDGYPSFSCAPTEAGLMGQTELTVRVHLRSGSWPLSRWISQNSLVSPLREG